MANVAENMLLICANGIVPGKMTLNGKKGMQHGDVEVLAADFEFGCENWSIHVADKPGEVRCGGRKVVEMIEVNAQIL